MYPNLNAELSRKGVTLTDLAEALDCTVATACDKKNGKRPFTLAEAKTVKKFLQVDIPLEELFEERSEEAV